jgi:DNA (cytosine-5)-methyltransferase 1
MIKKRIRRLTPTECERLMSWPDSWTRWGINEKGEKVEMSDSQRYKMAGNGVVSKAVEEVVKNLILRCPT